MLVIRIKHKRGYKITFKGHFEAKRKKTTNLTKESKSLTLRFIKLI